MSSESAKQKLTLLLAELKKDYLISLPQKLAILKELTEKQDWEQLENEYHKLKGTGKTYGFPEVSLLCQKMEELAQRPSGRDPQIFNQALTLMEKLHQAYVGGHAPDLESDSFWRSLLALPLK